MLPIQKKEKRCKGNRCILRFNIDLNTLNNSHLYIENQLTYIGSHYENHLHDLQYGQPYLFLSLKNVSGGYDEIEEACPEGTLFNPENFVCDWADSVCHLDGDVCLNNCWSGLDPCTAERVSCSCHGRDWHAAVSAFWTRDSCKMLPLFFTRHFCNRSRNASLCLSLPRESSNFPNWLYILSLLFLMLWKSSLVSWLYL